MGRHRQFDEGEALEAALSVFWQKGYEGTSFEDLTQATGVARPGLYSAFGNKEEFFLKALDLYDAKYMGFMSEALNEPTSRKVVERILRGSACVHTLNSAHPGCLGINGALACSDDAEPIRRELIRRRAATSSWRCVNAWSVLSEKVIYLPGGWCHSGFLRDGCLTRHGGAS